jgi:beta-lactamase superfamily II metal-dependent hydrolase
MNFYNDWNNNEPPLKMHVLSVGSGNMILLVLPNQKCILVDCNVTEDQKDEILSYLRKAIPKKRYPGDSEEFQWIDIFANSHRNEDHIRGLDVLNAEFPVRNIWDSGQTGEGTESADYQYYMGLRRRLIEKYGESAVVVPEPSHTPLLNEAGTCIYCLNSSEWCDENSDSHDAMLVLKVVHGGRSIMLPGDSDYLTWKQRIYPEFAHELRSEVLIASHHGSRSFFMEVIPDQEYSRKDFWTDHLKTIDPNLVIISVDDGSKHGHPDPEALKEYRDQAPDHVFTTHACGHLVGVFHDNGRYTVCPSRFNKFEVGSRRVQITARLLDPNGAYAGNLQSGCEVRRRYKILFTAITSGGLAVDMKKMHYEFEVSNGGIESDHRHQEIYFKKKDEPEPPNQFKREVAYLGRHLLRCTAWCETNPSVMATDVFVVNGI